MLNTAFRNLAKAALIAAVAGLAAPVAFAAGITSSVDIATLNKKKMTPLGLYLTPTDAQKALEADPGIVFLDVRDPIEINFVGHSVGMDANVPLSFATLEFNAKAGKYNMAANANFVADAEAIIAREGGDKSTPVFVMCRSGHRSARAAKALAAAGYTNVWNIVEGFEGDKDKATRQRTVNGWRNAGLPWTYKISADQAYIKR